MTYSINKNALCAWFTWVAIFLTRLVDPSDVMWVARFEHRDILYIISLLTQFPKYKTFFFFKYIIFTQGRICQGGCRGSSPPTLAAPLEPP